MSFLAGMGGPLAGALGGAINPTSGLGALSALFGKGGGNGAAQPAQPQPNAAATGLGKLIGVDGVKISSIADSVGKGMNMIAQGGGAQGGYAAPEAPQLPAVNNHMQLLDPKILQELVRYFSGNNAGGQIR